jgi:hypothetical protein
MKTSTKREFPVGFKKTLINSFFKNLENLEKIASLIEGFSRRGGGFNTNTFYWMDERLHPLDEEELKGILTDPEYQLTREEINGYISQYQKFFGV